MVQKHMTTTWLDSAKPQAGKDRTDYSCSKTRGLKIRVTKTGVKTWRMVYKFQGKSQSLTLGRYPVMSLAMARQQATAAWVAIEQGENPAHTVKQQKQLQKEALNFAELAALYMKNHAYRNKAPSSAKDDQRRINVELLPAWGDKKAHEVNKKDVIALIEKVYLRGAKTESNRYLSLISKIYNWAIEEDHQSQNPAYSVKKRHKTEKRRDRVLSPDEIKTLWDFLNTENSIHPVMRLIIRIILLTGQRTSEVCYARQTEMVMEKQAWIMRHNLSLTPPRSIKNKRDHLVMLAPMALGQFKQALSLASDSAFVFPNNDHKGLPFTMESIGKALQREIRKGALKIAPVHSRDLRRTVKTNIGALGVSTDLSNRITNHMEGQDDTGTLHYNLFDYHEEKLAVMEKWEARLQDIIAGKQVSAYGLRLKTG